MAASLGVLALIIISGLSDNPWIVWLTLIFAGIAASRVVGAWVGWLYANFARFRIRFLPPDEDVKAEVKGKAIVVALPTRESHIYFSLTPRIGIVLESLNIAFFYNKSWPLRLMHFFKPNQRCKRVSARAKSLSVMGLQKDWIDYEGQERNEEAIDFIFNPPLEF